MAAKLSRYFVLMLTLIAMSTCQSGILSSRMDRVFNKTRVKLKCATGCDTLTYDVANIGRPLQLKCGITCFGTNSFTWFKDNEILQSAYGHIYLVTNNVTLSEIAGHNYSCMCEENNSKHCFTVLGMYFVVSI